MDIPVEYHAVVIMIFAFYVDGSWFHYLSGKWLSRSRCL